MDDSRLYQMALSMVPGIGNVITKTLISYCGSAKNIFTTNKNKLSKIPGIGEKTANSILKFNQFDEAEKELIKCKDHQIDLLFFTDAKFPRRLKECIDAPVLLFSKGNFDLNESKVISIVGTRQATSYGREFLEQFINHIAPHQPVIVSGLAYGIDVISHKEALKNKLSTIGVMASGMDIIYPSSHKKYVYEMMENGGIVSEYKIGTIPDAHNFPSRNRIIAGLSDATIVVEASEKGGALITAEIANNYNRDVFAVPGNVGNNYSKGCNDLIKKHKANILTSAKDIEYYLNWEVGKVAESSYDDDQKWLEELNKEEKHIVQTILENENNMLIDDLSWKTQIPLNFIATHILNLEFKGIVKSLPGKRYRVK